MRFGILSVLLGLLVAVSVASNLNAADKETEMVFKCIDIDKVQLDGRQARILQHIRKSKDTVGPIKLVTVEGKPQKDSESPVRIPLPGSDGGLEIKNFRFVTDAGTGAKVLTSDSDHEIVHLTLTDHSWDGMIYWKGRVYHLQPLGDGLHVISCVNQGKLVDEPDRKQ